MKRHSLRMWSIFSIALFSLYTTSVAQSAADKEAFHAIKWDKQEIASGVYLRQTHTTLFDSKQQISIIEYSEKRNKLHVHTTDTFTLASEIGAEHKAIAAMNGSYFNVKTGAAVTFVKHKGKILSETQDNEKFRIDGAIVLRKGKIDIIEWNDSIRNAGAKKYRNVIAAGPVLVDEGESRSFELTGFSKRHPRSLIGSTPDGSVMLIVVDGRNPGYADGMSLNELVFLAEQLGLDEAINLDGGGSSVLWSKAKHIVNYPSDNKRFDHEGERWVNNVLYVK